MERIRIFMVVAILLMVVGIGLRLSLISTKNEQKVNSIPEYVIEEEPARDVTPPKTLIKRKWFPVPITSIEKVNSENGKYFVELENGMGFYTNSHHNMTDTIFWMDEEGKMITKIPKENK